MSRRSTRFARPDGLDVFPSTIDNFANQLMESQAQQEHNIREASIREAGWFDSIKGMFKAINPKQHLPWNNIDSAMSMKNMGNWADTTYNRSKNWIGATEDIDAHLQFKGPVHTPAAAPNAANQPTQVLGPNGTAYVNPASPPPVMGFSAAPEAMKAKLKTALESSWAAKRILSNLWSNGVVLREANTGGIHVQDVAKFNKALAQAGFATLALKAGNFIVAGSLLYWLMTSIPGWVGASPTQAPEAGVVEDLMSDDNFDSPQGGQEQSVAPYGLASPNAVPNQFPRRTKPEANQWADEGSPSEAPSWDLHGYTQPVPSRPRINGPLFKKESQVAPQANAVSNPYVDDAVDEFLTALNGARSEQEAVALITSFQERVADDLAKLGIPSEQDEQAQ